MVWICWPYTYITVALSQLPYVGLCGICARADIEPGTFCCLLPPSYAASYPMYRFERVMIIITMKKMVTESRPYIREKVGQGNDDDDDGENGDD
jgi:hypothetical protein